MNSVLLESICCCCYRFALCPELVLPLFSMSSDGIVLNMALMSSESGKKDEFFGYFSIQADKGSL